MINLSELLDRAKKKALEKPDNKDGYAPKSTDELRFKRKHVHVTEPDANKNGDDVFKGTNVKAVDRQPHYGYNPGQDEEVYEEVKKKNRRLSKLDEVLTPSMGAGAYIDDFVKSKNPKFAGKSKEKRRQMALAAYYADKKGK